MSKTPNSGSVPSASSSTTLHQDAVQHRGTAAEVGHHTDSTSDVSKDQKLAELQAQEIDKVKQSYEQHEERFGNRD